MQNKPIFSDDQLGVLTEELRVNHDRKVSVATLRDAVSVIENALFERLTSRQFHRQASLGRLGVVQVCPSGKDEDIATPQGELQSVAIRLFPSNELQRAAEDSLDSSDELEVARAHERGEAISLPFNIFSARRHG